MLEPEQSYDERRGRFTAFFKIKLKKKDISIFIFVCVCVRACVFLKILYELPTVGQWCFDLSWCKRNPDLICSSSYEGHINVYSLMGGKYNIVHQTSSKIMDSFGVDSNYHGMPSTPPAVQQQQTTHIIPQLKRAPKWMRKTCGATFAV
jgi:hypothetical protein